MGNNQQPNYYVTTQEQSKKNLLSFDFEEQRKDATLQILRSIWKYFHESYQ